MPASAFSRFPFHPGAMHSRFGLSVVVLLALAPGACKSKQAEAAKPSASPVERRDVVVDAQATGVVEPINVVEVKSKASGQIVRMSVETGSIVKRGDLLVQLDTRDVQNQYDQVLADVRAAQASLDVATAQRKRSNDLLAQRVVTAQENEIANLAYANAQAQVVRARTNLDLAKQRLEDARVSAPTDGTVIEKAVSLGQVIASATGSASGGTTLLKMADLSQVRVRALVNESDIGQVRAGLPATVTVDAYPDRPFRGTVEKIEPQAVVQQSVTMFPVLISLTNLDGLLKPGMNGEVSVLIERRTAVLTVPNDAIRTLREAATVAPLLGLDPDSVRAQIQAQMAAMGGRGRMGGSGGGAGAGGAPAVGGASPAGAGTSSGGAALGGGGGGAGGQRAGGNADSPRSMRGAAARASDASNGDASSAAPGSRTRSRPGLVFVAEGGTYVPRMVRLGASNFDYTEVVGGLKEGEQVAMLAAAALQAQRQQQNDRFRSVTGGGVPGMQRQQTPAPGATPPGGAPGGGAPSGGGGRRGGGMPF